MRHLCRSKAVVESLQLVVNNRKLREDNLQLTVSSMAIYK